MRMVDAALEFREDAGPQLGFTSTDVNRDKVKDDIVIRELVQNSLDASVERCVVRFHDGAIKAAEIPGWDAYRSAFESAVRFCEAGEPQTGLQVIQRVTDCMRSTKVRVLACSDNGDGIGADQLRSLYSSGRSTKQTSGRGSVGHGHLTAFAPSNLRYVLYAGRQQASHPGQGVGHRETFGGHAILATQRVTENGRTSDRSPDGFIRRIRPDGQQALFDQETGSLHVPSVIGQHLPDDHGSVVMILGYEPLSEVTTTNLILPSVARHFLVAVLDEALEATLTLDGQLGSAERLDKSSAESLIKRITPTRHRRQAMRTWRTVSNGIDLADEAKRLLGPGVRLWMRPALEDGEQQTRVSVFRDGMHIEDNTGNYLQPGKFPGVRPFDAVVDLSSTEEGSLGDLVRKSEGASHSHIAPRELADRAEQRALIAKLRHLVELLAQHAGKVQSHEPINPPELRLSGTMNVTDMKPRRRPVGPPSTEPGTDKERERPEPGTQSSKQPSGGGGRDREKTDETVKAGNSSGISTSCRPDPRDRNEFVVSWRTSAFHGGDAGLRMILPSGTDQTSRHRVAPDYLEALIVRANGETIRAGHSGKKEVRLMRPPTIGTAQVRISDASASRIGIDRGLVEMELVHRVQQPVAEVA